MTAVKQPIFVEQRQLETSKSIADGFASSQNLLLDNNNKSANGFQNALQVQLFYYILLVVFTIISCFTLYFVVSPNFFIHNHYHYFWLSTTNASGGINNTSMAAIFIDENFPATAFLMPVRRSSKAVSSTTKSLPLQIKVDPRPIINPFPYDFVIANKNACSAAIDDYFLKSCAQSLLGGGFSSSLGVDDDMSPCGIGAERRRPLQAVILVHTSPQALANRQAVRASWAAPDVMRQFNMRVLFVMGTPRVPSVTPQLNASAAVRNSLMAQALIVNESRQYGDIVQADFVSHYWNNTYTFMTALKWIELYCYEHTKFVIKTDDDFFVNLYLLDKYLKKILGANSTYAAKQQSNSSHSTALLSVTESHHQQNQRRKSTLPIDLTLRCVVLSSTAKPVRDRSKWYVSRKTWSSDIYPTTCFGGAVLFTPYMAAQLFYEAQRYRFFRLDDIFITGVVPQNISGMRYDHIPGPDGWIECGVNFMCIVANRVMFYHTQQNLDIMKKFWGSLQALHELGNQSGFFP